MRWGRWWGRAGRWASARRDRGSATAELAAGLPALMMLLLVGLTAVGAVTTKLRCVDAAGQAARAAARGESGAEAGRRAAPAGSEVSITVDRAGARQPGQATVTVTVRAPVRPLGPLLPSFTVAATAVAAAEPGLPEPES